MAEQTKPAAAPDAGATLSLTNTYQPNLALDEAYAQREFDIAWQGVLQDPEVNQAAEAGPGAATPGQVEGAVKAAEQPSAIATGAKAAFQAAGEGARSAMEGLTRTFLTRPQGGASTGDEVARGLADKAGGVRQFLLEGLMQLVGAPLIGLGAGARQALKNQNPALEQQVLTEDGGFIRMMLGGGNPLQGDEQAKAVRAPMTVGEALDIAVQQAPLAAVGGGKAVTAAKIQAPNLASEAGRLRLRGEVKPGLAPRSETMGNLKNIAAAVRHGGATSRAAFEAEMLKLVGEPVREYLPELFKEAPRALEGLRETTAQGKALISSRELLRRFKQGEFGMEWYTTTRAELEALFGEDWRLVADLLAATSANTSLDANVTKTLQLYEKFKAGQTPEQIVGAMNPADAHVKNVRNAFAGRDIEGPKVGEFAKAIKGDPEAVVLDLWMQRVFRFAGESPNESQRAFMAAVVTKEAHRLGIEPRQYQAALWVAQKILTEGATMGKARATELAGRSLADVINAKLDARLKQGLPELRLVDEAGRASVETTLLLARAIAGGIAGFELGEEDDDLATRVKKALVGAGLGAIATPTMLRKVKALGAEGVAAAKAQKANLLSERGSLGPGTTPPAAGAPTPEMRLNTARVDASDRVKSLMAELNVAVGGERLAGHREVISHAQTRAEGAALGLDDILSADPSITSIEAGRAVQQGLRNYYNAVATRLERMARTGASPDDTLDTFALGLFLAGQDERFGAGFARGLEARKIQSEAAVPAGGAPRQAARGRSAEGGLTQSNLLWLGEQLGVDPTVLQDQLAQTRTARAAQPAAPAATPKSLLERAAQLQGDRPATEMLTVADLVGAKIQGELALTTVAAELIRTAHGGRMPERVPIGEVVAAKIAAEWQAQQPVAPGPEAMLAVYKALTKAQQATEQAQAKAGDELASLIAGVKTARGAEPAAAPSVAELVAGKITAEQWAAQQAQGAPVSPEALRAVTNAVKKAQAAAEDAQVRAGDEIAAVIASAKVGAGQAARAQRETSVAELVIANMRAQLEATRPSPEAILAALRSLTRPQQRGWMATIYHGLRAGRDLFHEAWINMLLSNPVTHTSNLSGTGLSTSWEIPERYTAEMVNRLFFRDPDGVQRGETAAMLRSTVGALEDGIRLANKTWETGEAAFETGQVETHQVRARDYGFDPESMLGRTLDVLGSSLRSKAAPTRMLLTEDAFYKGINWRMEINALALREGLKEGKTGPALDARVAELEARPTPEMIATANDQATLRTLNRELGPAGQTFMRWASLVPGGRVVVPFVRTPTNIGKWTAQRTPLLNMLSQQNWSDIQAGGAARDKAVARMALGSAVGAVIAYNVSQGLITGQGSPHRNQRKLAEITGEKPSYALKVGDEWVKYARGGDPVAGMVGVIADFTEMASEIPDQEALDEWAAHGEVLALALGQTFVNKTYMQGLSNVLEALKQPDRNSKTVALGLARSLVPAGVQQLARVSDENVVREARTLVDAIKQGIPGLRQGVPAARNPITGEPVQAPAGWGPDMLSPVLVTKKNNDPVITEILNNKIDLAPVPWFIGGTTAPEGPQTTEPRATAGLKLTPEERDRWITLMTQDIKREGRTLHETLAGLVASDKYREASTGPDGGRALLIMTVYQTFREAAKLRLMDPTTGSPLLKRDLEAQMRKRLEQRLPTTDPRSPQFNPGTLINSLGR